MSRHPVSEPETNLSDEAEEFVAFMTDHTTPKAITRLEIAAETSNDSELSELTKAISGTTAISQVLRKDVQAKFDRVMAELCVTEDGIVMRGSRIVLPTSTQDRAVKTAHEGHQGRT